MRDNINNLPLSSLNINLIITLNNKKQHFDTLRGLTEIITCNHFELPIVNDVQSLKAYYTSPVRSWWNWIPTTSI